jgi:hypothetical protein
MKHPVAIGTYKRELIYVCIFTILMQGAYRPGMACFYKPSPYFTVSS